MKVLAPENDALDTDTFAGDFFHYSVLSFREYKSPDFYFEKTYMIEEWAAASMTLHIGPFNLVMPMHWSILCTDLEYVQSIPLYEAPGRDFTVFCMNPLDSYMPEFYTLRSSTIFPHTTWTAPPMKEKDMLTVPIGQATASGSALERGPLCAIFSPSKMEIYKPISDIW